MRILNTEKGLNLVKSRLQEIFETGRLRNIRDAEELLILLKCCHKLKTKSAKHKKETKENQSLSEFEDVVFNIEDEIAATEKYLDMYTGSDDPELKTMAQEELRHAAKLIKLGTPKALSNQDKTKMAKLNTRYQLLAQKLAQS